MNSISDYEEFSDSTEYLIISSDLTKDLPEDFRLFIKNKDIYLVADENTMVASGNAFERLCSMQNITIAGKLIFDAKRELTSDYGNIEIIKKHLMHIDAVPIAIGSGTVNDLVKRSAWELKRKYAIIATAASVDGYASDGAAILYQGLKQTLPCSAPAFIAADTNVLKNAPFEMTSSGYADLLAKNPAGADWIISDLLGLDCIDRKVWKMIQGNLESWVSNPGKLLQKDDESFDNLFTGLNVAGFAMQYMKRSRPVSGAEHLMSHIWEMEGHMHKGHHVSHGFKVAIGSLASIALMETVISFNFTEVDIPIVIENWPSIDKRLDDVKKNFIHTNAVDDLLEINKEKYINAELLEERLKQLVIIWPELQNSVKNQVIPYREYKKLLLEALCPVKPEDVGLSVAKVLETYEPAQMMRNRYTILDLAYETGLLQKSIKKINHSEYYLR